MSTVLCGIGKGENRYVREWVEHYKNLGVKNIILYDNNDPDGEYFEDSIGDYINEGFVIIKNYRGRKQCQEAAYNECYAEYSNKYDWFIVMDCDEYVTLEKFDNIDDYLSQDIFKDYDCVRLSWRVLNDSGHYKIENNNFSRTRFTEVEPPTAFINKYIKTIYRSGLKNMDWSGSVHGVFHLGIKGCDAVGRPNKNTDKFNETPYAIWEGAWIDHYRTRTLEEYIRFKMVKLYPDHTDAGAMKKLTMVRFFRYNNFTWEKWKFGLNLLKELKMEERAGRFDSTFVQFAKN